MLSDRYRIRFPLLPCAGCALLALGAWASAPSQESGRADDRERTRPPEKVALGEELQRDHLEFRRQVEAAFRKTAGGAPARADARDAPASQVQHSYDTQAILITSLERGILVAGAPVRSTGAPEEGLRRARGEGASDRAPDGTEPEGRRALGALLISNPQAGAQGAEQGAGQDGAQRERRPVPARALEPGFYLVRPDALGSGVELVDRDGRIRRTIPLTDHQSSEDARGDAPSESSTASPAWEQVYGRILVWIAPQLDDE